MNARALDVTAFVFLYGQLVVTLWMVPAWSLRHFREPAYLALLASVAVTVAITVNRLRRPRGSLFERRLLASFLAGMPLVYLATWAMSPQPGWLGIEIAGALVFGTLAVLGLVRSPWFLAGGILAHGVFWDLWHHGRTSFVPDWYTLGCLVADVGLSVYTAAQVRWYRPRPTVHTMST